MPKSITKPPVDLYTQRKRRVLGEVLSEVELKTAVAWLAIHTSSQNLLLTYESRGLVMSINGSGSITADHPMAKEAADLAKYVSDNGGIIINGGRASGIMAAATNAAGKSSIGIIFPELKNEASRIGQNLIINAPTPRVELLATCTPIVVVFRGGLGTFMVLMRAIVHIKNRKYHPDQPSQLVYVSNYWIGLLTTMINLGVLPKEFVSELKFFDQVSKIIKDMPLPSK